MSRGISAGSGASRSNRYSCSIHVERGGSSFHTATGAVACAVQRISGRLEPSSSCFTFTCASFLTCRIALAASLHGPGTPGVSTTRRPGIPMASSTST